MENVKSDKKRKLTKLMVLAWVAAATLGGCVVSLNVQKNNSNSEQKVEQSQMATQKNDSTNFKLY
jgi:outer membrane biogenesis lipoprotein LolB